MRDVINERPLGKNFKLSLFCSGPVRYNYRERLPSHFVQVIENLETSSPVKSPDQLENNEQERTNGEDASSQVDEDQSKTEIEIKDAENINQVESIKHKLEETQTEKEDPRKASDVEENEVNVMETKRETDKENNTPEPIDTRTNGEEK